MEQLNFELFRDELTAALTASLGRGSVEANLAETLVHCAAAAEAHCSGRPMACGRGCPHCCVLNVSVLLPEAMLIAERITQQWAGPDQADLLQRLRYHSSWVRWMDDDERISRRATCPLLDANGDCSIHPHRPLTCRGVASLDCESCRQAFDPIISDQDRSVPADLQRRSAYDAAFIAMAGALRHHGLDDRSIELGTGIRAFAEAPELRTLFLSGGRLPRELWG
jgi:Fe-S-cluster containining protein